MSKINATQILPIAMILLDVVQQRFVCGIETTDGRFIAGCGGFKCCSYVLNRRSERKRKEESL